MMCKSASCEGQWGHVWTPRHASKTKVKVPTPRLGRNDIM